MGKAAEKFSEEGRPEIFRKKSLLPLRTVELEITVPWCVKTAAGDQAQSVAEILER